MRSKTALVVDGNITQFAYDPRNLVNAINYSGGKEAQFAYNKNGELIAMMDWNGTVNYDLDVLDRIISVNDQNEKITGYSYDAVGNQTGITYPDNTVATYSYDLLSRLTNLKDAENQNTVYQYNAAGQLISMAYPNGWNESYSYDDAGQLLTQLTKDPTDKSNKSITHNYSYDDQGNILGEARTGAGGQDKFDYTHTYDALNRLTQTTGLWGYPTHTYEYDSLGNLVYEKNANGNNKGNEYWYNNLNQQIRKQVDGKDYYSYSFDKRGNLTKGVSEKKNEIVEQYLYDATNRMVKGVNDKGEQSHYVYNGLGYLVSNEWVIEKNSYGYHGIGIDLAPSEQVGGVVVCDRHSHVTGNGHINPTGKGHTSGGTTGGSLPNIDKKKVAVVHKDFVLDYTSANQNVIMESESGDNSLTYRYTYGLQKVSAVVYGIPNGAGSLLQKYTYPAPNGAQNVVKLYYHHDHLGTTDFLTDNVSGKVTSYTTYDDWGMLTAKAIVKMGVRELDLVQEYTGHAYDQVLNLYYAKARMYDSSDRRFMSFDLVKGTVTNPQTIAQYVYCLNNSLIFIDPLGFATKNPIDLLSDKTNFTDVSTTTYDGSTYYHIGGVMKALGGEWPYYDVKLKTVTLLLSYKTITMTVNYNVSDVSDYDEGVKGCIIYAWGSYTQDLRFNFMNGQLPILYQDGRTYVDLDVLKKYFEQIWCGSDYKDNQSLLSGIKDPTNSTGGRDIILPNAVTGSVNNAPKSLSPRLTWYSYQGNAAVKDSQGRYRIVVGPKVLNANYLDTGRVWDDDFNLPARINVVLENKSSGDLKTIECITEGGGKAHTFNEYPHNHPKNRYSFNGKAKFDVESGYLQTGIVYPNANNAKTESQVSITNMDGSSIEFLGRVLDFNPKDYTLVKIIGVFQIQLTKPYFQGRRMM